MDKLSDDMITAWLDGEVTPAERREIEAAIAASPELGVRVARLSRMERSLAPAFAETLNAPIPQRFEALLERSRQVRGNAGLGALLSRLLSPQPLAMAAASLVVGVVIGGSILSGPPTGASIATDAQGRMIANETMATSLATLASGTNTGPMRIRLSMVDDGGRYCRQFEMSAAAGLACREGDQWMIDTLSQARRASSADGGYVMADGSTDEAVSAALQRRGVQRVLDAGEEAAAIASGWK